MKAKEAAQAINRAVEEQGLEQQWIALRGRLAAGATDAEAYPEAEVLAKAIDAATDPTSREYLAHLLQSLGTDVTKKGMVKTASVKAAILAADQAWRAFHARLNPLSARKIDPDGFKNTLEKKLPALASLGWGNPNIFGPLMRTAPAPLVRPPRHRR